MKIFTAVIFALQAAAAFLPPAASAAIEGYRKMTWPDPATVTTEQRYFVVSIGGLGAGDEDGIKDIAKEFAEGRKDVVVAYGVPHLNLRTVTFDVIMSDEDSWPKNDRLAADITSVMERMAPDAKLILIGKSMGGCKVLKVLDRLRKPADLLITVDASCTIGCHRDTIEIGSGARRVYNFIQKGGGRGPVCGQCGHMVKRSGAAARFSPVSEMDVNADKSFPGSALCNSTDHCSIDNCTGLLDRVRELVRREIDPPGFGNAVLRAYP